MATGDNAAADLRFGVDTEGTFTDLVIDGPAARSSVLQATDHA